MTQRYMAVLSVVLLVFSGCSIVDNLNKKEEPPIVSYEGPLLVAAGDSIPNVPPEVKFADFWIRQSDNPDDILMTLADIDRFNADNPLRGTELLTVIDLPQQSIGDYVRDYIAANARYLADHDLYITGDIQLENAERQRIIALMDTTRIPDVISLRFGVMLRREMGKLWPTMIPLLSKPNDIEFDQGTVSAIDMCEPVALLHTSHDGRWSYIQHASFTAWIPSDAVAFGDTATVRMLTGRDDIIVAVGHRVSIYGTPESGAAVGAIQMGSCLRIDAIGNDYISVLIPGRGETGELVVRKGFVRRDSTISLGFLPYTLSFDPEYNKFVRYEVSPPKNPFSNEPGLTRGHTDGPAMDGWYYWATWNGTLFKFRPEGPQGPQVELVGTTWDKGRDTLQMALDPTGRYVYYYPKGDAPIVQYDVKTGKRKALCWLQDYIFDTYGYFMGEVYGMNISADGSFLVCCMNGEFSGRDNSFGHPALLVVEIPKEERP